MRFYPCKTLRGENGDDAKKEVVEEITRAQQVAALAKSTPEANPDEVRR